MKLVRSIDLWTEQKDNHDDCFLGAFVDGFDNGEIPYDQYKILKNCNCEITCSDENLNITNKHNAIIFYKEGVPVRLLVANEGTDIDNCIEKALDQTVLDIPLRDIIQKLHIKKDTIDLGMEHVLNNSDHSKEIDVGSCDRYQLLDSMLEGSYTESSTGLGKDNVDTNFHFEPNLTVSYNLIGDNEWFYITHHCAFINSNKTRIIPLQDHSKLDINKTRNKYIK